MPENQIQITIGADVARIQADMGKVSSIIGASVDKMSSMFQGLKASIAGIVSVGAFGVLAKDALETAHNLELASQKYGVSTDLLSKMGITATLTGVDLDTLGKGMRILAKNAMDASDGTSKQADAFRALGVNVKDSNGQLKPMSSLMAEVASAFSKYADSTEKTALAQKLLGRAGADLIPFFNAGGEAMRKNASDAEALGATWDDKTAKSAADLADDMHRLGFIVTGLGTSFIKDLAPAAKMVIDDIVNWAKETGAAQIAGQALSDGVKVIAGSMYSLVLAFKLGGTAIGGVASTIVALIDKGWGAAAASWDAMKGDIDKDIGEYNKSMGILSGAVKTPEVSTNTGAKALAPLIESSKEYEKALVAIRKAEEAAATQREKNFADATKATNDFTDQGLTGVAKQLQDLDKAFDAVMVKNLAAWEIEPLQTYLDNVSKAGEKVAELKNEVLSLFEAGERLKQVNVAESQAKGWNQAFEAAEKFNQAGVYGQQKKDIQDLEDSLTSYAKTQSDALESGAIDFNTYNDRITKAIQLTADLKDVNAASWGDMTAAVRVFGGEYGDAMAKMEEGQTKFAAFKDVFLESSKTMTMAAINVGLSIRDGLVGALSDVIMGAKTAGEAFAALGKAVLKMIVDTLLKWIINRTIMAGLEAMFTAEQVATTSAAAAVIGAAWIEPAFLASVATLGGADAEGLAALGAGMAAAAGLMGAMKAVSVGEGLSPGINTSGAAFASGTDYVPRTMNALVHEGERILTPDQNKDFTEFLKGDGTASPGGGSIYLDGYLVGKWLERRAKNYGGMKLVLT